MLCSGHVLNRKLRHVAIASHSHHGGGGALHQGKEDPYLKKQRHEICLTPWESEPDSNVYLTGPDLRKLLFRDSQHSALESDFLLLQQPNTPHLSPLN